LWPFTRVLSEIVREVTRKPGKTANDTDGCSSLACVEAEVPTIGCPIRRAGSGKRGNGVPSCRRYLCNPRPATPQHRRRRVKLFLLFVAEFLKTRIISERIEHWIEPEQRGSEGDQIEKATARN
jgi:hypothetical protein